MRTDLAATSSVRRASARALELAFEVRRAAQLYGRSLAAVAHRMAALLVTHGLPPGEVLSLGLADAGIPAVALSTCIGKGRLRPDDPVLVEGNVWRDPGGNVLSAARDEAASVAACVELLRLIRSEAQRRRRSSAGAR